MIRIKVTRSRVLTIIQYIALPMSEAAARSTDTPAGIDGAAGHPTSDTVAK
jgi:hypothetical protein